MSELECRNWNVGIGMSEDELIINSFGQIYNIVKIDKYGKIYNF